MPKVYPPLYTKVMGRPKKNRRKTHKNGERGKKLEGKKEME
jgi:hypothetical protein